MTTEITMETSGHFIVHRMRRFVTAWCVTCGRRVKLLTPEDGARITGISTRKIYAGIEAGNTHFDESADGRLLVCLDSLERSSEFRA